MECRRRGGADASEELNKCQAAWCRCNENGPRGFDSFCLTLTPTLNFVPGATVPSGRLAGLIRTEPARAGSLSRPGKSLPHKSKSGRHHAQQCDHGPFDGNCVVLRHLAWQQRPFRPPWKRYTACGRMCNEGRASPGSTAFRLSACRNWEHYERPTRTANACKDDNTLRVSLSDFQMAVCTSPCPA